MSPYTVSTEIQQFSVPRASGDEPPCRRAWFAAQQCSPRERG